MYLNLVYVLPAAPLTFNETTTIFLFADPNTPKEQISAAFAHELGHAFIHSLYPNLTDTALNEGMATWLAEKFWVAWKMNSFDNEIRSFAKRAILSSALSKSGYDESL